jgi:hypothetical protein
MPKPKQPRKKAPEKELTHPKKATPKKNHYFSNLMKTPEGRALRKQWSTKPRKNSGRPVGVVDGYTKEMLVPIREKSMKEAEEIVKKMSKDYNIEDEYAKEALKTAVQIMREPAQNRDKLAAARMVLDFTKSKPVAKSEVAIGKAEAFLSSLLEDDDQGVSDGSQVTDGSQTSIH